MPIDALIPIPDLTIYRERSGFDALQAEWDLLLGKSVFRSIFLTWAWQTTWWDRLGQGELLILAWRNDLGELIGIAPLFYSPVGESLSIQIVGCKEVADYLDIIIAEGHESEVYTGFLQFLAGEDAPTWGEVELCNLHETSLTYTLFADLADAAGYSVFVTQEDVAPYLLLVDTFDDYMSSLDKKQRHELRRKRRKLDREVEQWRWFQIKGGADLDTWVDRFIDLHRRASADKQDFMDQTMVKFFHDIAQMAASRGWLSLAFIEVNGELAATLFNFDYDGRIWLYNSGYDPASYRQLSPGIILNSYLIEDAIETGHKVFDFLQGDEVYKYRFGASDARVMDVRIAR